MHVHAEARIYCIELFTFCSTLMVKLLGHNRLDRSVTGWCGDPKNEKCFVTPYMYMFDRHSSCQDWPLPPQVPPFPPPIICHLPLPSDPGLIPWVWTRAAELHCMHKHKYDVTPMVDCIHTCTSLFHSKKTIKCNVILECTHRPSVTKEITHHSTFNRRPICHVFTHTQE